MGSYKEHRPEPHVLQMAKSVLENPALILSLDTPQLERIEKTANKQLALARTDYTEDLWSRLLAAVSPELDRRGRGFKDKELVV